MRALWTWDHVGKNTRDCMITLIPFGFCVMGMGIAGNVIFPVCYKVWAQTMALGIMYLTAGSVSISAANGRKKSNYLARISVSMMLHVLCWLETLHIIAIAINLMTKSFFDENDGGIPETQCPYGGTAGQDQDLYYILGGVTLGLIVLCLILSSICFTAFWKSPEWFEPVDTSLDSYRAGVQLNPVRGAPPRRENTYLTPHIGGGDVARSMWPTPDSTPAYATAKRDLSGEMEYTVVPYNSSGHAGGGKSLRIVSADRQIRKTCVVATMRELILVAKEKMRFNGDESLGICFDATGEDIEDEAAFQSVPDSSRLMIFSKTMNEQWEPPKYPFVTGFENEGFARDPPDYTAPPARRQVYNL